jgi:hypothetical protein
VQLRFDLQNSPSVPQHIKARAIKIAGRRINKEGVIVLGKEKLANMADFLRSFSKK